MGNRSLDRIDGDAKIGLNEYLPVIFRDYNRGVDG
jgi:hypothetical protein